MRSYDEWGASVENGVPKSFPNYRDIGVAINKVVKKWLPDGHPKKSDVYKDDPSRKTDKHFNNLISRAFSDFASRTTRLENKKHITDFCEFIGLSKEQLDVLNADLIENYDPKEPQLNNGGKYIFKPENHNEINMYLVHAFSERREFAKIMCPKDKIAESDIDLTNAKSYKECKLVERNDPQHLGARGCIWRFDKQTV